MKTILWLLAVAAVTGAFVFFVPSAGEIVVEQTANAVGKSPQPATILAFGDMMLDRAVRTKINAQGGGYLFEKIRPLFAGQDVIVANAEGVFTDNPSISVVSTSTLVFTFSTTSLPLLEQLGFSVFSQANNHALNFGWKGLAESKAALALAGMDSFGDPDNVEPGPLIKNIHGISVAFVGYNQFSAHNGTDTSVLLAIEHAKQQGAFVIVYPHWGVEYQTASTSMFQRTEAHRFIDAGADAVLGAHPHVVEPMEIYKGKAIFYSLGNFIFDQPWDDTREGLGVELSLTDKTVIYTLVPFEIQLMQPSPMQGALRSIYLLGFSKDALVPDDSLRPAIASGSFMLQR